MGKDVEWIVIQEPKPGQRLLKELEMAWQVVNGIYYDSHSWPAQAGWERQAVPDS